MNVLALGGCGDMGCEAVKTLVENKFSGTIKIADINEKKAQQTAARIGGDVLWEKIDITDGSHLARVMAETDLVINTIGPYFKFGLQVLEAAIRNKCHYIDICDDWEPTLEMLSLDAEAKKAGITAVVGMGATPGMGNLLASMAMKELDQVEDVYIGWNIEAAVSEPENGREHSLEYLKRDDYQPNSALIHGLHQLSADIRVRRNGGFVNERPFKPVMIDYPGLGRGKAWSIGHPEPLTLPRYFPEIRNCLNLFFGPRKIVNQMRMISRLVRFGLMSIRRAAMLVEKDEIKHRRWEKETMDWRYKVPRNEIPLPPLFAVARGEHEGKSGSVATTLVSVPPGKMAGITGIPLAVGSAMIAEGGIKRQGVFAPEGGIDPHTFFDALAPLCKPAKSSTEDLILITKSWEDSLHGFFQKGG